MNLTHSLLLSTIHPPAAHHSMCSVPVELAWLLRSITPPKDNSKDCIEASPCSTITTKPSRKAKADSSAGRKGTTPSKANVAHARQEEPCDVSEPGSENARPRESRQFQGSAARLSA
ncbi:unnamed protein product [Periconia digitata]|uniref:Uncharacterized protein n=1 Tax=Periconia digitata TaxID=1303443 RepID=A0A9W4U2T0_9PLEO|nr:unnamed protein product [Periconia digitata]